MSGNGQTPVDTLLCGGCGNPYDADDNFCRQCGVSLHDEQLPSVRDDPGLPAVWRPSLPAVIVRGVAIAAAGTLAETFLRRFARGVVSRRFGGEREPDRRKRAEIAKRDDSLPADTQMVSETLFMRRVRFRR